MEYCPSIFMFDLDDMVEPRDINVDSLHKPAEQKDIVDAARIIRNIYKNYEQLSNKLNKNKKLLGKYIMNLVIKNESQREIENLKNEVTKYRFTSKQKYSREIANELSLK